MFSPFFYWSPSNFWLFYDFLFSFNFPSLLIMIYYLKWGALRGRTTHLSLWSDSARDEVTCLAFGAISTVRSELKMKENEKSFKLFLILDTRLTKKKSLIMTLGKLLSFIDTVICRYTRRVSRGPIFARRVACVLNGREFCALRERRPLSSARHVATRP